MYDDWANEIGVADPIILPLHDIPDPSQTPSSTSIVHEADWDDDLSGSGIFNGGTPVILLDDGFVIGNESTFPSDKGHGWATTMSGAGGDDGEADLGETAPVVADRPDREWDIDDLPGGGGSGDGGTGSVGGSGGGEPGQPPEAEPCPSTAGLTPDEIARRDIAEQIGDIVRGQNWENQEYGGFIYRDNATGRLTFGSITSSNIGDWTPSQTSMEAGEAGMGGITSWSQIVGIFNSHGPNVPGTNHNYASSGDYGALRDLIVWGASADTRLYIMGADGQTREYESSDQGNGQLGDDVSCP